MSGKALVSLHTGFPSALLKSQDLEAGAATIRFPQLDPIFRINNVLVSDLGFRISVTTISVTF